MLTNLGILVDIAEKAARPDEYPERLMQPPHETNGSQSAQLLKRWESLVTLLPQRDSQDFEQRLESLELDRESALAWLNRCHRFTDETLPFWAKQLAIILNQAIYPLPSYLQRHLTDLSEHTTPLFLDVLHPFLQHYVRTVRDKVPAWSSVITPSVWDDLLQELLVQLSDLASRAIAADVKQKSVLGHLQGRTSAERYQYYTAQVVGTVDGLVSLLQRYPVFNGTDLRKGKK